MPLHRNESSGQKTLNFKGNDKTCFVKENNHLSRERTTVMTIVSSTNKIKTPPIEFVFKGTGKRVKVNPPAKTSVQWAEKGSNRLEHILEFNENLPTIPTAFAPEKHCVTLMIIQVLPCVTLMIIQNFNRFPCLGFEI